MSKVANKRKNDKQFSEEEKPAGKKIFNNEKNGVNKNQGQKKNFKNFKQNENKENGQKTEKKEFKYKSKEVYKKQKDGDKQDKKAFKPKEKFDKKTKKIFAEGENQENDGSGILISEINVKVNKIQSKDTPQEEKEKYIDEYISKLSGVLKQIVHKRDGSRSVQACIKNGNDEQREKIFNILLDSKELDEIIKSKYGHFVALRMIKYLKNKTTKDKLFEVIKKNAFYLVTHVEGAKVLDKFVINNATPAQFNTLKKLFSNKLETAANLKQEEAIENIAAKIIDKGNHAPLLSKHILHLSLPILIPVEREKVIEYLREKILDLVDDKEGIKLALDVINYSTPKDKKLLAKNLKDHIFEIINSQHSQAFVIIIKLLFSWDDTVQANKSILAELKPRLDELLPTKNGISFFSAIFQPKHNALTSLEKEIKFTTSKKPLEQKLSEVIESIFDDLVNSIPKIPEEQLFKDFNSSRFLSSIIRHIFISKQEKHYQFAFNFVDKILKDGEQFLSSNDKKKNFNDECLLSHHDAHRIMKNIILIVKEVKDEPTKEAIIKKISNLTNLLLKHLSTVLSSRATYLLVALIENDINKKMVIDAVKKDKNLLQKQGEDNKGATLLKSIIEGQ
ncbi:hypothetical protein ABPG74_018788 [Tetrahymena malaccensis]